MAKNQESINRSLFELLRTKGYHPTMLDTSGKEIPVPEEAEVFQFKFTKEGKEYGTVTVTIDGLHKLVIYFGEDVANSEKEQSDSSDTSWYSLLKQLKRFALSHQLSFDIKNVDNLKYDMAKRDHMKKQEQISEGYYPMGKKASYSDNIPQAKIIIQHTRQIEEGEQRYRNVDKIFVENVNGERFLLPTNKPGLARVYARHIAEGGTPYDERGKHITGLVEEYQKMSGFVRATRGHQFNENAQKLVEQGLNHYQSLRETLHKMTGRKGYVSYFESYTPPLMEDDGDDVTLNELFVQETLDPRIENVMPILKRLSKNISEMKEVNELAEWANGLTEGDGEDVAEATDLKSIPDESIEEGKPGLWANIHAKRERIKKGSGEKMRKPGSEGAPSAQDFKDAAKTSKKNEGMEDTDEGLLQLENEIDEGILDTVKKVGSKVLDKLGHGSDEELIRDLQKKAGVPQHSQKGMAHDKDENQLEEVDLGQYDAVKTPLKGGDTSEWDKNFREKLKQYNKELDQRQKEKKEKSEKVEEDLGPEQKRVGQLGPTEKVKNNNIGKLVGANESVEQGVAEGLNANNLQVGQLYIVSDYGNGVWNGPYASYDEARRDWDRLSGQGQDEYFIGKWDGKNFQTADEQGVAEGAEEGRPYVCVHVKKGKCQVTANSSYEAAKKAAQKWGLKSTAGIDAHLADVEHTPVDEDVAKGLNEMDSEGYKGTRDDYELGKGKEHKAKPTKAEKMMKDAEKAFLKHMSPEEKVDKGYRNPNIKEGEMSPISKGRKAGKAGKPLAPPYPKNSKEHAEFTKGWNEKEDIRKANKLAPYDKKEVKEGQLDEISKKTAADYVVKRIDTDIKDKTPKQVDKMIKGLEGAKARYVGDKPTSPPKDKVKEGQEDLDAILRIIRK